jgi:molybdopterin/thiamine biosynthesis adenylyltransferase/rhodanese-related sulfurtransferase
MASFPEILAEALQRVAAITPEALRARLAQGELALLDVRSELEWKAGSIAGAVHLPENRVDPEIEELLPNKQRPIVVFCSGEKRAALAGANMLELGYANVLRLAPGFDRWRRLGFEVTVPKGEPFSFERYRRQLVLREVGELGQLKLRQAKVLLVGLGGLGSPAALYLAAAGVGTLGLCDADRVELSNLHRQILHSTAQLGELKVKSAEAGLGALNPEVRLLPYPERLTTENARNLVTAFDLVVDGSDNVATRYALNAACVAAKRPLVFGSVHRFSGQVTVFGGARAGQWEGPCYNCMHPQAAPAGLAESCEEAGVLGALPGLVGTLQAVEVLKLILGAGQVLTGRVLLIDALGSRFSELRLRKDPRCTVCSEVL